MTEVEVYQPPAQLAVREKRSDFDSWIAVAADVVNLAQQIHNTPFVPDGLRGSAPAVAAAILAGREMGLGPMTALQHIHVIKGKPGQSALLMRALIIAAGHQWQDVDISDARVVVRGRRRGEPEWTEASFTAQQAKQAGIDLGKYPQDKLYARATTRLARRAFADVIMGMPYAAEELDDGDAVEDTAATTETAAIEAPKTAPTPRTARRRTATATPQQQPAAAAPGPAAPAGPPLPGEEQPDPSGAPQPGTASQPSASATGDSMASAEAASRGLVGICVAHFKRLGYADDERDQRIAATAVIISRDINSANDLTTAEARKVADTLARCRDRDQLNALLVAGDKPEETTQ